MSRKQLLILLLCDGDKSTQRRDIETAGERGVIDMDEPLHDYDPAAALDSQEAIEVFMVDAFETGDAAYLAKALGVVARAKGMARIARETGLSHEQLYRSLSERVDPTLKTTLAVMCALGLDRTAKTHAGV